MKNHGNLILKLFGQARGRAAEYWGKIYLASDVWVARMGIPKRAREWYASQDPLFLSYLDAFADGINSYAKTNSEQLDDSLKAVLPVSSLDVLAHTQRVVNFSFVVDPSSVDNLEDSGRLIGSNAWAIAPSRSKKGHSMLLTNPHMPWADFFMCFEAHLNAPGVNAYGIALVGFPVLTMAFNDFLGWAHTVNTYNGWTLYELEVVTEGYIIDGEIRALKKNNKVIRIKQEDGTLHQELLLLRNTLHGPVIEKDGKLFALRIAGLEQSRALEQWWKMSQAKNLAEFEGIVEGLQIPMFTLVYADRDGHIMHLFNGRVPIRQEGDFDYWSGVVPGNTFTNIWTATHPYKDLPRIVDPESGWVHNSNDPPYTATFPSTLNPDNYPSYMAPRGPMSLRAQRSARILMEHSQVSLDDVIRLKYSTTVELATRVLDELIEAGSKSSSKIVLKAVDVLTNWDRSTDADSKGAVLFVLWAKAMNPDSLFAVSWSESDPLSTPRNLADTDVAIATLEHVASDVETIYGSLDVAWGKVFKLYSSQVAIPAISADKVGVFPELWYYPTKDNKFVAVGGECYTAVVEFSNPVRAMVLTIYGNATQPSLNLSDEQLKLFACKQLRPALLTRAEILDQLLCHEVLNCSN